MKSIILPGQKTPGWPKAKKVRELPTDDLETIFASKWKEDVHFVQYAVIPEIGPFRYNNEIFASPEYEEYRRSGGAIQQIALAFDVDSPAKKSQEPGAVDTWFEIEREKISRLLRAFPGGMVWRTKGGWRGCWYTERRIVTTDDTAAWRKDYLAAIVYLEREFGIVADPACNDWNRLHRVPFGIRDTEAQFGWGEPETRETIGRLEKGKILDLASIAAEQDRIEARRRHLSAWKSAPKARNKQHALADEPSTGPLLLGQGVWEKALRRRGQIIRELGPGKWAIPCPNAASHTTAGNETSTVLYAPGPGEVLGHPHCSHHHCQGLDFRTAFGIGLEEWQTLTRETTSEPVSEEQAIIIAGTTTEQQETTEEAERRVVAGLIPGKNGVEIDGCPENIAHILLHHPEWKGLLVYDSFRHEKFWRRVPEMLSNIHKYDNRVLDVDSAKIQGWFLRGNKNNRPRISVTLEAVRVGLELACHENVFDSLRDHVLQYEGKWDGSERLNTWLHVYMGADDNDLNAAIGKRWLMAAVARALDPGCVADMMPILEGAQEIGKNYMLDILFGDFVTVPHGLKIGSKDFEQKCSDSWCIHDDELASTSLAGLEITKSWLTQKTTKFRKAHAIDFITVPRRFIVVGSTNKSKYLRDEENRRFWPVYLRQLRDSMLVRDREQLWSEAIAYYNIKTEYRITKKDKLWDALAEVHDGKRKINLFEERIRQIVTSGQVKAPFQMHAIFSALDIRPERWTDASLMQEIGSAMSKIGLLSKRYRVNNTLGNWWEWREQN